MHKHHVPVDELKAIKKASSIASTSANHFIDKRCSYIRTESQLRALETLANADGPMTARKCAEGAAILGPALSRMIRSDQLLRIEKLITVEYSDYDNRVLVIKVTAKGRKEVDRYYGK